MKTVRLFVMLLLVALSLETGFAAKQASAAEAANTSGLTFTEYEIAA